MKENPGLSSLNIENRCRNFILNRDRLQLGGFDSGNVGFKGLALKSGFRRGIYLSGGKGLRENKTAAE